MSGKTSRMNPLASRKKLLIAESELNRAQLVQELETVKDKFHSLANQARTISSIMSAAATLIAGLASSRRLSAAQMRHRHVHDGFALCRREGISPTAMSRRAGQRPCSRL